MDTAYTSVRRRERRFGRTSALLDDGYRINRINGLNTIVINDQASEFRFRNTDALASAIEEYTHWYNTKRISTKLKGLSPVQYRAQALAA